MMRHLEEHSVTVSKKKFAIGTTLSFDGYLIVAGDDGVRTLPDPSCKNDILD